MYIIKMIYIIYGIKKNGPDKLKYSFKELQYVKEFYLFLSYKQSLIHMQFFMFFSFV